MSTSKNFKEHWINFFSDEKKFKISIKDDGDLETITISSPNLMNQTTIELAIFIDDDAYFNMYDIRFLHPLHIGFNKYQLDADHGIDASKNEFNVENIKFMESMITNYLEQGFSEIIYAYNDSHFKSEITILNEGKPETFTWHDKEHMMSNKIQRFLNKSFITKRDIKGQAWI